MIVSQAAINEEFNSFKVKVDVPGYGPIILHYAHHISSRANAIPLLIAHGWPGSFLEARKLLKPLTEPPDHSTQAFHLIIPSIPGYGPGDAPTKSGFGPVRTARAFKLLMVDALGYQRFVTQGGDWGSFIVRSMAMQYPQHVRASHHNVMFCGPPPWYKAPVTMGRLILSSYFYSETEQKRLREAQAFMKEGSGYLKVQSTRPQSLGFGLGDSPIGLLGWLVEKDHDWMDSENYQMPDDEALTFVMMHWMQGPTPGLRYYKAAFAEKEDSSVTKAFAVYHHTPIGISVFPKEALLPPRDWVSAIASIQFWREHTSGGHFPHVERPNELVEDLREFFSSDVVKLAMTD